MGLASAGGSMPVRTAIPVHASREQRPYRGLQQQRVLEHAAAEDDALKAARVSYPLANPLDDGNHRAVETFEEHNILMGKVSFDGVVKKICLAHVLDAAPGDYVLVHVGFALSRIDEEHAREVFTLLEEMEMTGELRDGDGAT